MDKIIKTFQQNFFSAIVEFHQGAPLLTVWSQNSLKIGKIDDFLYYVGNTHSIGKEGDILIPPIITQSTFEGHPYFSITSQIPDVNARGFLRVINLIVAHNNTRPIVNQELVDLMNEFQQNALKLFFDEIPTYFLAVNHFYNEITDDDMKKPVLLAMIHEMTPILKKLNIDLNNYQKNEKLKIEHFVILNNELRNIKEIIKFDENLERLNTLIDNISLSANLPVFKKDKELDFGISSIQPSKFLNYTFNLQNSHLYENNQPNEEKDQIQSNQTNQSLGLPLNKISSNDKFNKIKFHFSSASFTPLNFQTKLNQNEVFGHLIFSLLSGCKLVIVSKNNEKANELTEQLIHFIPNFDFSKIHVLQGKIEIEYLSQLHASIIICNEANVYELENNFNDNLEQNKENQNEINEICNMSIINLDECLYQGLVCGQKSFVWQLSKIGKEEEYRSYVARSYYQLKTYADNFIRVSNIFLNAEFRNKHQFMTILHANKFQKDDLPMLYYWSKIIPSLNKIYQLLDIPCRSNYFGTIVY
ncbi:hypothetical protein TRFO_39709 [Tritrichomonas foetus]|uniref:UDENN FLCN/SMCR8-type domain-containing protein n=1 Tax=Tritrichomonas foetus TaxID=1144522 RepID=A0A1J4J3Y6_9EUKA|nr:hypothetical protein TRFO_39709 [Tritrichomonas foetus]|eukprot:OHS94074.1 hypothetical protein TRFO_39709 [Tritrichomonas foetus]